MVACHSDFVFSDYCSMICNDSLQIDSTKSVSTMYWQQSMGRSDFTKSYCQIRFKCYGMYAIQQLGSNNVAASAEQFSNIAAGNISSCKHITAQPCLQKTTAPSLPHVETFSTHNLAPSSTIHPGLTVTTLCHFVLAKLSGREARL